MRSVLFALALALATPAAAVYYNINQTRPIIFGLRGAGGGEIPNTLQSYASALANGAHGIAVDVRLTADAVAVLLADDELELATNCTGRVSSRTWAELQGCTVCAHRPGQHCGVPALSSLLDLMFMMRGVMGPTLLYPRVSGTVAAVLDALDQSAMRPSTWIAADSSSIEEEYASKAADLLRVRLYPDGGACGVNASVAFWADARAGALSGVACGVRQLSTTILRRAHTQHITTMGWMDQQVVSNATLAAAVLAGLDMVVTTNPEAAARVAGITRTPPPSPPPPVDPSVTVRRFTAQVPRAAGGILIAVQRNAIGRVHLLPAYGFPSCDGRAPVTWSAQGYGCVAATNAGFFDERGDQCQGRLVANGADVSQPPGDLSEAGFGITRSGVAVAGMLATANATAQFYREYISGSNVLVFGGKAVPCSAATMSCTQRAPRTTVGVMSNGDVAVVSVDGVEAELLGPTIPELADILVGLGVSVAINLDGGGSTTTTIAGQVFNEPTCIDTSVACERSATSIVCVAAP